MLPFNSTFPKEYQLLSEASEYQQYHLTGISRRIILFHCLYLQFSVVLGKFMALIYLLDICLYSKCPENLMKVSIMKLW